MFLYYIYNCDVVLLDLRTGTCFPAFQHNFHWIHVSHKIDNFSLESLHSLGISVGDPWELTPGCICLSEGMVRGPVESIYPDVEVNPPLPSFFSMVSTASSPLSDSQSSKLTSIQLFCSCYCTLFGSGSFYKKPYGYAENFKILL